MLPRQEVSAVKAGETQALQAARDFAAVLAKTPEFEAFDEAQWRLHNDGAAQTAIRAFQERQQSLRMMAMLGMLSDADRRDLQRLHAEMLAQPAVQVYAEAQERLSQMCQEVDRIISQDIGIDFAANCGTGCC